MPPLELTEACELLGSLLRQAGLPGADPLAPIQVLLPTEAEGLRFDHLWLMGLAEQHWPPAAQANPFLPLPLQRRHGLPDADAARHGERAAALLDAVLASCAGQAVLSYPLQLDDADATPCAWLLAQTGDEQALPAGSEAPGLPPLVRELAAAGPLETLRDSPAIPLPGSDEVVIPGGGTALLADQAACPFRAFARHRLGARPLPRPGFGLPPTARGNILHSALELLWERLRSQQALLALDEAAASALLREAIDRAIAQHARRFPQTLKPRLQSLEAARLRELLSDWLRVERERGGFRVAAREYALQWRHSRLVLKFRIDRVEQLDGGGIALVDYKSGHVQRPNWLDERPDQPQLPLYLLAAEGEAQWGEVTAVLFAEINIDQRRFLGLARDEGVCAGQELASQRGLDEIDWDALKRRWQEDLARLAEEFLGGRLSVSPKHRNTCQYCHLGALCRIGDPVDERA